LPKFDLSKYATVAERIQLFYADYPDGRIITENLTTLEDRAVSTWVIKASIYLTAGDLAAGLPKATGHAFEVDGGQGANLTSALENGESSSVGRALSLGGYSASKELGSLASREEMEKVERGITPTPTRNWVGEADLLDSVDDLRLLWNEAKANKAPAAILLKVKARADQVTSSIG